MQKTRRIELAIAVMVIAVLWLVVLPRLGTLEPVADHLDRLDRHGIEADAMYWTELESVRFLELRDSGEAGERPPRRSR